MVKIETKEELLEIDWGHFVYYQNSKSGEETFRYWHDTTPTERGELWAILGTFRKGLGLYGQLTPDQCLCPKLSSWWSSLGFIRTESPCPN